VAGLIEAELKLRATGEASLEALTNAPALGRARLGPAVTVDEFDVYLDTPDRRLAAARWACRVRSREGRRWISLKGPAAHQRGEPLHRRPEIEGPGGADPHDPAAWPDSPARAKVLELAGEQRLAERVTLRQRRTERSVTLEDEEIGTLSLDRVEVLRHEASLGRLFAVELELADPERSASLAPELLRALSSREGLAPEAASKLELALRLVDGP
jgi:triphosphatase